MYTIPFDAFQWKTLQNKNLQKNLQTFTILFQSFEQFQSNFFGSFQFAINPNLFQEN